MELLKVRNLSPSGKSFLSGVKKPMNYHTCSSALSEAKVP
jgi:hypothetical protein